MKEALTIDKGRSRSNETRKASHLDDEHARITDEGDVRLLGIAIVSFSNHAEAEAARAHSRTAGWAGLPDKSPLGRCEPEMEVEVKMEPTEPKKTSIRTRCEPKESPRAAARAAKVGRDECKRDTGA